MLSQFYPPAIGGEERHVQALSQGMALRGHQVSVATIAAEDGVDRDGPVRVHRLRTTVQRFPALFSDPSRPYAPPLPDPGLVRGLRRVVAAERPDVVHAHNWIVNSALPLAGGRSPVLLLTLHDYSHVCATKRLMLMGSSICPGPAPRRCLGCASNHYGALVGTATALSVAAVRRPQERRLSGLLAVSEAVARGSGLDRGTIPCQVIPNFVPDALWEEAGERIEEPGDPFPAGPFILFVGDLMGDKGIHVLLEAYRTTPGLPPLVLMGRRAKDTPADLPAGVRVLHDCPHRLVMRGFRSCRLAVAPSVWPDPCPTVVLEAMSAGCPLVTTPVGGITDMVTPEEDGVMVPPGDAGALGAALARLDRDPALRRRLGAAARRRARRFTAADVLPRVEAAYRGALDGRRPAAIGTAPGDLG